MGTCSKSLPPTEFQIYVSSADSGIDSDASTSTNKLYSSLESMDEEAIVADPKTLLCGEKATHEERVEGIGRALKWLREELVKMKETDRKLTKKFINMRSTIAEYKDIVDSGGLLAVDRPLTYDTKDDSTTVTMKKRLTRKCDDWKMIAKDGAFPTNGLDFENNKRATWVI